MDYLQLSPVHNNNNTVDEQFKLGKLSPRSLELAKATTLQWYCMHLNIFSKHSLWCTVQRKSEGTSLSFPEPEA